MIEHSTGAIYFLESLGFRFSLDLDDELEITCPEFLSPDQIKARLLQDSAAIVGRIKMRAKNRMRQFVGGPFNGEPHALHHYYPNGRGIGMRVARAEWAAYWLSPDGRAFFQGMATSEKKAKGIGDLPAIEAIKKYGPYGPGATP